MCLELVQDGANIPNIPSFLEKQRYEKELLIKKECNTTIKYK